MKQRREYYIQPDASTSKILGTKSSLKDINRKNGFKK